MNDSAEPTQQIASPRWRPLSAIDRRVIGVLVEKAKTTPEAYPLSINALRSGANQKNNRFPTMEIEQEDIEESLERLRGLGAVVEVQGGGRVPRFRHCLYEWLGVDKVELAVMAELLLRGTQTEGELRGRAARMEPIADLAALRPVLVSLKQKGLVISLSPDGRGHVVTHGLYEPRELEKQRAEVAAGGHARPIGHEASAGAVDGMHDAPVPLDTAEVDSLRREVEGLRGEVAQLRSELESLRAELCG
jgi:uncharacterized protein YceH (UPF0502 family)